MKYALNAVIALAVLVYGAPRMELTDGRLWQNAFGVLWVVLAILVAAAHLYKLFGTDEAAERELARIKRAKWERWEHRLGLSQRSEKARFK